MKLFIGQFVYLVFLVIWQSNCVVFFIVVLLLNSTLLQNCGICFEAQNMCRSLFYCHVVVGD